MAKVRWVNSQIRSQNDPDQLRAGRAVLLPSADPRATFGVGRACISLGQAEFFASHEEPRALPTSLLNFLFDSFDLDQNGNVISFGFPKQNLLWRMASHNAWNCRAG